MDHGYNVLFKHYYASLKSTENKILTEFQYVYIFLNNQHVYCLTL